VGEAIAYMRFGFWGNTFLDAIKNRTSGSTSEYDYFLQAAADGEVTVWGRKSEVGVYEPIPHEYWFSNRIDWFGLMKGKPDTESNTKSFRGDRYLHLMTSRVQVEAKWPPQKQDHGDSRFRLAELRADGVTIRNAALNFLDASSWVYDTHQWMNRVIDTIKEIDKADAEMFRTLDAVPPPRVPHHPNASPQLAKAFREHDFRLVKLERLIEKYGAK
jgi:hypothetical protein